MTKNLNNKVFLIANNEKISEKLVDELEIGESDLLVLFNHCFPVKFKKIKEHKNKIVFIRKTNPFPDRKDTYSGLNFLNNNYNLFLSIHPCNGGFFGEDYHSNLIKNLLELKKININLIEKIRYQHNELAKKYFDQLKPKYTAKPTTGFMAFCYIEALEIYKVHLVGFDLIYKGFHDGQYELNHYEYKKKEGDLIKIDC